MYQPKFVHQRQRLGGRYRAAACAAALAVVLATPAFAVASTPSGGLDKTDPGVENALVQVNALQNSDLPFGDFMSAWVTQMEAKGFRIGRIHAAWTGADGVATDLTYSGNTATETSVHRTFDATGKAHDTLLSRTVIATAQESQSDAKINAAARASATKAATSTAVANNSVIAGSTAAAKISSHPPKAYFDRLTALDRSHGGQATSQSLTVNDALPLDWVQISQNVQPAMNPGAQNQSDLLFWDAVTWYNPAGKTNYHSAYIFTSGKWNGGGFFTGADPGDRDAMDGEFDPGVMYMNAAGWAPDKDPTGDTAMAMLIANCRGGTSAQKMDVSTGKAWWGAYSQKPSHCSRSNTLIVDIRPKSAASYGVTFSTFYNYTHTWNYAPTGGIGVTVAFKMFAVDPGFLGGEWNDNDMVNLLC